MRALACASGLAIACSAFAGVGATPEAPAGAVSQAKSRPGAALDPATAPRFADASHLLGQQDAKAGERFGLRAPVYPGTVCTTENPDTCFDWDISSSGGIIAFNDFYAVIDSIYLVRNDFNVGTVNVSQMCFGTGWFNNGSFLTNDPNNPFETNYRITFYPSDTVSVPGTNFPDVANPIAEFVEATPGPGQQSLTAINVTYNERLGGLADLVHVTFPAVALNSDTCYWIGVQNDTSALSFSARPFGPYAGVLVDNSYFQDSNSNGIFEAGERNGGDLGWCVYGAAIPGPGDPTTDYFLDFGDPNLGGACYINQCNPEATNTACTSSLELFADDDVTPSGGLCNLVQGAPGGEAANCPIWQTRANEDLGLNIGVWYTIVGDGSTYTASTDHLNSMGILPDTVMNLYCNDISSPGNLDCSRLYCLASDDDGSGVTGGPAELSWATENGRVYYLLVHLSGSDDFAISVSTDGVTGACVTFNCSPLVLDCPDGASTAELTFEPCDDGLVGANNGCNAATPALPAGMSNGTFQPITPGTVYCGTSNRVGGTRDTDWYYLNLAQNSIVTWSVVTEFPSAMLIIDLNDKTGPDPTGCTNLTILNTDGESNAERGDVNDLIISLPAGEYAFFTGQAFGVPYEYSCASGQVDYSALLTVEPVSAVPQTGTIENGNNKCTPTTRITGFGSDPNRGCFNGNTAGVAIANMVSGTSYRGQSGISATDQTPDADAWQFTLAGTRLVTFDFQSQFPATLAINEKAGGVCEAFFRYSSDRFDFPEGQINQLQAILGAGTYHFIVLPETADDPFSWADLQCSKTYSNQYHFTFNAVTPCTLAVPGGAVLENENWCASGDSNGGCEAPVDACSSSPGAQFAPTLTLGQTGAGKSSGTFDGVAGTASRDIDVWRFDLASQTTVTVSVDAEFPIVVQILDVADCDNQTVVASQSFTADCATGAASFDLTDLPAGNYGILVTVQDFGLIDCTDDATGYDYTVGIAGGAPPCRPDLTTTGSTNGIPDGVVNGSDFTFFLSLFAASDSRADFTTTGSTNGIPDGVINGSDFTFFLSLFAAGCP